MNLLTPRRLAALLALLAAAALAWFFLRPDPKEAFLDDVDELLELANTRRHLEAAEWFSPDAAAYFQDSTGMPLKQLLLLAKRHDEQENRLYQAGNLDAFYARDYAEIRIQRSAPGGAFGETGWFSVPFLHLEGGWKIAPGFRGDKSWDYPEY